MHDGSQITKLERALNFRGISKHLSSRESGANGLVGQSMTTLENESFYNTGSLTNISIGDRSSFKIRGGSRQY